LKCAWKFSTVCGQPAYLSTCNGAVEDTAVFEDSEDKANGHGIGDGFSTSSSKSLTIPDAFPEILDTVLGGLASKKVFAVGIKVSQLDGTIGVENVMQAVWPPGWPSQSPWFCLQQGPSILC